MAQATFSVRMDETLKKQFEELCSDFGMNISTAFNIFARAVVREKKIPFEIKSSETEVSKENLSFSAYQKPTAVGNMSREELDAELIKGMESLKSGKTYTSAEVDTELFKEFGI